MSDVFSLRDGDSPLLVSVPHDGRLLPDGQRAQMTQRGRDLPDTDWHVARLYEFARDLDASIIVARYSRYVVDLNRPPADTALYEGQVATGLCPQYTFAGEPLYRDDAPVDGDETGRRLAGFWQPYHDRLARKLQELRERHGYALLWDAHSIPSRVPRLFDGELPVLNLGTYDDRSCGPSVSQALLRVAQESPYDAVLNARFKGGYITRQFGDPGNGVRAVQLEIAQRAYMDEASRDYDEAGAGRLRVTLRRLLETFLAQAQPR